MNTENVHHHRLGSIEWPFSLEILTNPWNFFVHKGNEKQFHIQGKIWKALDNIPRKELYETLSQIIRVEKITFPALTLKETFATDDFIRLKQMVQRGADFLLEDTEPRYSFCVNPSYNPLNSIQNPWFDVIIQRMSPLPGAAASNLCQYHVRTHASCHPLPTPIEIWNGMNKKYPITTIDKLRTKMISDLHKVINSRQDTQDITENDMALCISKSFPIPSQFPPYAVPAVIRFLREQAQTPDGYKWKIFDPCAGWSDRLVGALASGNMVSHYIGVDPNLALIPGQKRVVELCPSTVVTHHIPKCAEDIEDEDFGAYKKMLFDLVFTSPPFFNKEHYSDCDCQSIKRYCDPGRPLKDNLECWLERFLFPMLEKAWLRLKPGGFLAIHIDNLRIKNGHHWDILLITDPMNHYIGRKLGGRYAGVIGLAMNQIPDRPWGITCDPIWVWRKELINES